MGKFKELKKASIVVWLLPLLLFVFVGCHHQRKGVEGIVKTSPKKTEKPPLKKVIPPAAPSGATNEIEQKLGVSKKEIQHSKLYSFINEWYGSPYKYGGCQKNGIDCSCFTCALYTGVYGASLARTAGEMYKQCDKIALEDMREGDLLFFKINSNSISHVGVFVKGDFFVHASTSKGVMLSSIKEAYYQKYFYCAGRIRKDIKP